MKPWTAWPWMSMVIAVALLLTPAGLEIVGNAFLSGEQLSRSIGQFMVMVYAAAAAAVIAVEWLLRAWLLRRSRAMNSGAPNG